MSKPTIIRSFRKLLSSAARNSGKRTLTTLSKSQGKLKGSHDLPSVDQFTAPHIRDLGLRRDVKGMFTSDPQTIEIADKVLRSSGTPFYLENIFDQPHQTGSESGSKEVMISDIGDFPEYLHKFTEHKNKGESSMVCVGGPAAEDQVLLSTLIESVKSKLTDIVYLVDDHKESNIIHSAQQSHARHGSALNASRSLTGHSLLPKLILRKILGVNLEKVVDSNYLKIDISDVSFSKLRIYFGNEINWLKQEYRKINGKITEFDISRLESSLAQEILRAIEKEYEIGALPKGEEEDLPSVHVVFDAKSAREVEEENKELLSSGIKAQKLTPEEMKLFFGEATEIHSAWKYPKDTHTKFDIHEKIKDFTTSNGARWLEGSRISNIFLTKNKKGQAELAGLRTAEGEYIYANNLHFTGGYKTKFVFDKESSSRFQGSILRNLFNQAEDYLRIQNPISSKVTVSTGVSINAIFRNSERLQKIIEKYGSTGAFSVTNSHWTMIAHDKSHIVMRITGGGNTGSEEYNPAYLLNIISNTRRIFGDDLVGILSSYGCPRAVNAKNATEFSKIAEGSIASYGKGGTGNTKRQYEAAKGLILLGFKENVLEYFDKIQGTEGESLGEELSELLKLSEEFDFFKDETQKTNRRMGYDDSLSSEEKLTLLLLLVSASYALKKTLEKDDNPKIEEIKEEEVDKKTKVKNPNAEKLKTTKEKQI